MVLAASDSRSSAASVAAGEAPASDGFDGPATAVSTSSQSARAARDLGADVEARAGEGLARRADDRVQGGVEAGPQRGAGLAGQPGAVLPLRPQILDGGGDALGQAARGDLGGERLDLLDHALALLDPLLLGDLVTRAVALEELVARGAEPLPQQLGAVAADRADRLPVGLELLDAGQRRLPVGRLGERLGLRAERFLLRRVLGPRLLQRGEVGLAAREERVAGGAEAARQLGDLVARRRAGGGPLRLQLLQRLRGRHPVGGLRQGLGRLAQRHARREVDGLLGRDQARLLVAARLQLVGGALEALPQRAAIRRARR